MISIRTIAISDVDLISRQRKRMFEEAGWDAELGEMTTAFREWLKPKIENGTYFGFIVQDEHRPVAGIGLVILDWPPHPAHPTTCARGYVMNVFVEPPYRKRGIATGLMERACNEFKRRGVRYATLHATTQGGRLYARLGWMQTTEMATALLSP